MNGINSDISVISPWELINKINNQFSFAHEQQYSYELYHRLFDILDNSKNASFEVNPFTIEFDISYYCTICQNTLHKKEINYDLSIVPDIRTVFNV
jgi:hypothetical protein